MLCVLGWVSWRGVDMRRRQFITLFGGAAAAISVARPRFAAAQPAAGPVIGFLHSGSPEQNARRVGAYLKGLRDAGFIEGQNVAIEYRWAGDHDNQLPELAADLVRRQVAVIVTPGSTAASIVAKHATSTIPIVFTSGSDPVELGLVASLNRPGGNLTGITSVNADISAKRFGVLHQLLPHAAHYFALINPASPLSAPFTRDLQGGAASLNIHIDILRASTDAELEAVFATLPREADTVLISSPDAFFYSRRSRLAALTASHALPAIFDARDYVEAGALVSYGADYLNVMQLAGNYTARILKGEKPADLPVVQPQKFELVINLKTAKALGITVPPMLLATVDDVVE
jgi:putative tryptophan/tyrosine transport system substrate-binding protein